MKKELKHLSYARSSMKALFIVRGKLENKILKMTENFSCLFSKQFPPDSMYVCHYFIKPFQPIDAIWNHVWKID